MAPGMASAMQFSEPELIGEIGTKDGRRFFAKQALTSSIDATYYDFQTSKGPVRFYLRDSAGNLFSDGKVRFGSTSSENNAFSFGLDVYTRFYEVKNDSNKPIYIIQSSGSDNSQGITIVGKNQTGNSSESS